MSSSGGGGGSGLSVSCSGGTRMSSSSASAASVASASFLDSSDAAASADVSLSSSRLVSSSGLDDAGKSSGSVMSEMRALFTPPGRDSKRHQTYMQLQQPGHAFQMHPYYKRPGNVLHD